MDFINTHAPTIIAVIGTLSGVLISQLSYWLMKKSDYKNQVKLKRIDLGIEFEKRKP